MMEYKEFIGQVEYDDDKALMKAVSEGHTEIVELLKAAGAVE